MWELSSSTKTRLQKIEFPTKVNCINLNQSKQQRREAYYCFINQKNIFDKINLTSFYRYKRNKGTRTSSAHQFLLRKNKQ